MCVRVCEEGMGGWCVCKLPSFWSLASEKNNSAGLVGYLPGILKGLCVSHSYANKYVGQPVALLREIYGEKHDRYIVLKQL